MMYAVVANYVGIVDRKVYTDKEKAEQACKKYNWRLEMGGHMDGYGHVVEIEVEE